MQYCLPCYPLRNRFLGFVLCWWSLCWSMSGAGIPVVYHTEQDVPSIEMANTTSAVLTGSWKGWTCGLYRQIRQYFQKQFIFNREGLRYEGKVYVMKGRSTFEISDCPIQRTATTEKSGPCPEMGTAIKLDNSIDNNMIKSQTATDKSSEHTPIHSNWDESLNKWRVPIQKTNLPAVSLLALQLLSRKLSGGDGTPPDVATGLCADGSQPQSQALNATSPGVTTAEQQELVCADGASPDPTTGLCADGSQPKPFNATAPGVTTAQRVVCSRRYWTRPNHRSLCWWFTTTNSDTIAFPNIVKL